jgi:hypothetical protein
MLPKLYHGLVHRSIIESLRLKNHEVLYGTSPDMSAAISLSVGGGEYYIIDFPFTLPGGAGGSNSGRSAAGKHKGTLATDPHIAPFKNLNWPNVLPKFFSVETVWAHAAWETLKNTGENKWIGKFNLAKLYALCLFSHMDYRRATLDAWKEARISKEKNVTVMNVAYEFMKVIARFIIVKFKRILKPGSSNGRYIVGTVDNVRLARKALDEHFDKILVEPIFETKDI